MYMSYRIFVVGNTESYFLSTAEEGKVYGQNVIHYPVEV